MFKLRSIAGLLALATLMPQAAYAVSVSKDFVITNTGDGLLTFSGVALSGNTTDYALTGNTCTSVAPGGSCILTVKFTPKAVDARPEASLDFSTNGSNGPAHKIALKGAGRYPVSCKDLLTVAPGTPSGKYTIDPDGAGAVAPFSAYCDMTTNGGGWTMVTRQYEDTPVYWNGANWGGSFSLSQAQIPAHTQVGFGKDSDPTFVDYVSFQYTTGNIPVALVTGLKTGWTYHIHRDTNYYYDAHNPEEAVGHSDRNYYWANTLTFDRTGGRYTTWAFSIHPSSLENRGYAMNADLQTVRNAFAWTVWVR